MTTESAAGRMRGLVEADPVVLIEIAGAISDDAGRWPPDAVTALAAEHSPRLADADKARLRATVEQVLLGRDVDAALEWLHETGILAVLFPELAATVDLVQETGRQHKDVWAHTKQVVRQTVRRPLVRWAALLHDIGKVPTRTFTPEGVHFHGHAEVGARMFDKVYPRFAFARDERQTIRFLVKHHLRTNQYGDQWTDSAVRRFHREMGPHMTDLLDLSRADITSKRPGRRKQLLEQISALADRVERLAEEDARLPPLPGGVGNAIMTAFEIRRRGSSASSSAPSSRPSSRAPSSRAARTPTTSRTSRGTGMVPGVSPERAAQLAEAGGLAGEDAALAEAREAEGDFEGVHRGVDPEDPSPGVLACGHDPENDPCVHRDVDPADRDRAARAR